MPVPAQMVPVDSMTLRPKLLKKLTRADLPESVRESLRLSIVSLLDAYQEDDDPKKVAPNILSFEHLLKFIEHPYRWDWAAPALSVSPEGTFSAIWDEAGVRRWVLDFSPDGEIEATHLETYPDGRIDHSSQKTHFGNDLYPPFRIAVR